MDGCSLEKNDKFQILLFLEKLFNGELSPVNIALNGTTFSQLAHPFE
jgi:hypothetical protein